MKKKLLIPIFIITIIIGLFIGHNMSGTSEALGVNDSIDNLDTEKQIEQLTKQVAQLQNEVNALKKQINPVQEATEQDDTDQPSGNEDVSSPDTSNQQQTAYVKDHDFVNVRQGPGTNYPVLSKVYKNSPMTIIDEKDKWYRVKLENGKLGWVANWVVEVE